MKIKRIANNTPEPLRGSARLVTLSRGRRREEYDTWRTRTHVRYVARERAVDTSRDARRGHDDRRVVRFQLFVGKKKKKKESTPPPLPYTRTISSTERGSKGNRTENFPEVRLGD